MKVQGGDGLADELAPTCCLSSSYIQDRLKITMY